MRADLFRQSAFAATLSANPIVYVDIGSRGGFETDLLPWAFGTEAIGFEPAPEEFARLQHQVAGPWKSRTFLPHAVSGASGKRRLHIPEDPIGASLLPADEAAMAPFDKAHLFDPKTVLDVDTLTLPDALAAGNLPMPDYLKIDVEGAEHEILSAAPEILSRLCVLKIEVAFLPMRQGHPLADELTGKLRRVGLQLFDLIEPAHWRDRGNIIHPLADGDLPIRYSRGQIVHGDFVFFRTVEAMDFTTPDGRMQAYKTALLAMSFGYFDYAARILAAPRMGDFLADAGIHDAPAEIAKLSAAYGRLAFRQAFCRHLRMMMTFMRRCAQAFR